MKIIEVVTGPIGPRGEQGPSGSQGPTVDTSSLVTTSSFNTFTSSYVQDSSSFNTRITSLTSATSSYILASQTSSMSVATASFALNAVSASYTTVANSVNNLNQSVFISGSLTVLGGATIFGSTSFQYVTASQLAVSASFISVNIFEPVERFGGLKVYDSGSSNATASLAWDSVHNHWVYQNVSGSTYTGGMLLAGPRNTGSLGDEPNLTQWYVPRSDGGDHLDNSQIYSSGSVTQITGNLTVTGSFNLTGSAQSNVTELTISSNTASLNLNSGNFFTLQLLAGTNTFINPINIKAGQSVLVEVSTTGSATVSFPSSVKQPSGSTYVPTTTTGIDILTFAAFNINTLHLVTVKNLI